MARHIVVLLLTLLIPPNNSENILVACGTYGSHLYVSAAIADVLVAEGHNVTLLSLFDDMNVDFTGKGFHWIPVLKDKDALKEELDKMHHLLEGLMELPSRTMLVDLLAGTPAARQKTIEFAKQGYGYFTGEDFARVMADGQFDLVIAEDTALGIAVPLLDSELPVIGITSTSVVSWLRSKDGYPSLQNSEPNGLTFPTVRGSLPSFSDRWAAVRSFLGIIQFLVSLSEHVPILKELNPEELERIADVRFVMDHPAIGFPYLVSPNTFYLGFFHLQDRQIGSLPSDISNFIANCPYKHVAYMSFGSFLTNITSYKQTLTMIRAIEGSEVCLLLKSGPQLSLQNTGTILARDWFPQKDLLGSGKIDFFISHCGNNGRLESIYYGVPLLCVPLFADQLHNADRIQSNGFGRMVLREDVTEASFADALLTMKDLGIHFKTVIRNSVRTVKEDPGAGLGVLKYHVRRLLRNTNFGTDTDSNGDFKFINYNTSYLKNTIITQQSVVAVYNLDIMALIVGFVLVVVVVVLLGLWKLFRFIFKYAIRKVKSE